METQIALTELVWRLSQPRLVVDPPPYRPSPLLRSLEHLLIAVDGVRESQEHLALAFRARGGTGVATLLTTIVWRLIIEPDSKVP